jgi:glucose/arabinose dehydrogenase
VALAEVLQMIKRIFVVGALALFLYTSGGWSQQQVPFESTFNIPVAPTGLSGAPLGKGPFVYNTGENQRIRAVVLARGLTYPWSLAFLPDGAMLVTERTGNLRIIRNGVLDPKPVAGVPKSQYAGASGLPGAVHGLMDIALHPRFAENRYIYLTYTKPLANNQSTTALARGRWNGTSLENVQDIFVTESSGAPIQSGSRIAFGRDGTLFMTVSGGTAQDGNSHGGKVLRLNDDGSVPKDNPFVGRAGYKPQIYSLGHRNLLGLAVHPLTGAVWANENGPNGGDEINIIQPGRNYGWPLVTLGRTYQGPWQSESITHAGYEQPVVFWMPAIAISGMAFYTGNKLPKWKGDVFAGSLRFGEIPGTGHLERILFNEMMEELRREWLLADLRQRIRDVRQGPDELLYVLTDEQDGAVIRIEPAP